MSISVSESAFFLLQGSIGETMNLFTRVQLIRNLHYFSIGLFQKRDPECHLKVNKIIYILKLYFHHQS